jgi:hypothetical protein
MGLQIPPWLGHDDPALPVLSGFPDSTALPPSLAPSSSMTYAVVQADEHADGESSSAGARRVTADGECSSTGRALDCGSRG